MKNVVFAITSTVSITLCACAPEASFSVSQSNQAQANPDGGIFGANVFDIAASTAPSKIDVLFVIDNSGSMAGEQATLAAGFADFIRAFQAKAVDFHLGVITTDVQNTNASDWANRMPAGFINPNRGDLLSRSAGQRFLTSATPNLNAAFSSLTNVGTRGSGAEQGLKSLGYFLEAGKLGAGGTNAGFVREDALLSIVVLSDENECTVGESADSRIDGVLNRLKVVKGSASRGYSFHFINSINANKPNPVPAPDQTITSCPGEWFYPTVYLRAAERTGSPSFDIARNFANDLGDIGESIVNQNQSKFKLSSKPAVGSVQVTLGGTNVAENGANGFVVDYVANTIELRGAALASSPGKRLVVNYLVDL